MNRSLTVSIKGVRIIRQVFGGTTLRALASRSPPIVAFLLQRNFFRILPDVRRFGANWLGKLVELRCNHRKRFEGQLSRRHRSEVRSAVLGFDDLAGSQCWISAPEEVRVLMASVAEHVMDGSEEIQCARRLPASLRRNGRCACD